MQLLRFLGGRRVYCIELSTVAARAKNRLARFLNQTSMTSSIMRDYNYLQKRKLLLASLEVVCHVQYQKFDKARNLHTLQTIAYACRGTDRKF